MTSSRALPVQSLVPGALLLVAALIGNLVVPTVALAGSPAVSINRAVGQADPANRSPINFTVEFTDNVYGFTAGDLVLGGSAGYDVTSAVVTGGPKVYNVAVSGMTAGGEVVPSVPAGVAFDALGGPNLASTSTDNRVYWWPGPLVAVNKALGQASPVSGNAPIHFTVAFTDPVEGFTSTDVNISGSAGGTKTATVTGGPNIYDVAVAGMTTSGSVTVGVSQGAAHNPAGEPNFYSDSSTNNTVDWVALAPGTQGPQVDLTLALGQTVPAARTSPINLTVVFSSPVSGFVTGDMFFFGTAGGAKTGTVTGGPTTFNVAVAGMTTAGYVGASVPSGVAFDLFGRPNVGSGTVVLDWAPTGPSVTINQATGQADPAAVEPVNFSVVFSSAVTGFSTGDVTISGTAGGPKTATVTGSGSTYNLAVIGMTSPGTVIAAVPESVSVDANGRPNLASTSSDNTVTWAPSAREFTLTTSAPVPPGAKDPVILWGQGFTLGVSFAGTGANRSIQLQGTRDGLTWTTITSLTTDATGLASLLYRPVTNLYYRAVFAGAPDLPAITSNEVRTVVRQLAVMRPTNGSSSKSIARNTSVTFTTTVRPARPELAPPRVTFQFYRQVAGALKLITTRVISVDSAGKAVSSYKFVTPGQWYVRSQAGPTPYNANSVPTPSERFSVR